MRSPRTAFYCLLPVFVLFTFTPSTAQEIQRPFTEDGTIQIIDRTLEEKLQLFPDYEGFREAYLYQVSDTSYVLEVIYRPDEEIIRNRTPLTVDEVEQLRDRVDQRLEQLQMHSALDQEGRTELLVTSTLLSLGFYGYALPIALDIRSSTSFGALYLLTSGSGFFVPFALTRNRPVTEGQAKLFQYGGTRGIAHGVLLGLLAAGEDLSGQGLMGLALLTSLSEGAVGYGIADAYQMTQGTAETIGVTGDFGLGFGLGTALLIDDDDPNARLMAGPGLLGTAAGLYAGHRLSRSYEYTTGDARILRLTGSLGTLLGITVIDWTGTRDTRSFVAATMATSLVGLGMGRSMLRDKNFGGAAGTFITLGTIGGLLTGQGIAYLISGISLDPTPFLTLGSLGAVSGFALVYRSYTDEAQMTQTGWKIRFNPGGLVTSVLPVSGRVSTNSLITICRSF